MPFAYTHVPDWPYLSWLARGVYGSTTVEVFHGTRVEIHDDWFCEATWSGDFELGDFDQTDIVAGSGGRLRHGKVVFVASGSTVDRLHSLKTDSGVWVSNSLPCLLASVEASVDPYYEGYFDDFESIIHGVEKYKKVLNTSAGSVYLTYFDNLLWDGQNLHKQEKPAVERNFSSFSHYRDFLVNCIQSISENMVAKQRHYPYRKIVSTCSSGYDSAAVTALVKQAGCKEPLVLSFDRSREGDDDSGEAIAASLGIPCIVLNQSGWRRARALSEVPFIAASPGTRDLHFKEAEDQLIDSVLFSGFRGGTAWEKTSRYLDPTLVRRDDSGLGLSEFRLWVGFLHCPVPFIGARQAKDINAISHSEEVRPWDIGGDYNRPIPRRILEEAGVPRGMFGVHNKAAGVFLHSVKDFLTPLSKNDFHEWLKEHYEEGQMQNLLQPFWWIRTINNFINRHSYIRCNWINNLPVHVRGLWRLETAMCSLEGRYVRYYVRRYTFPWAIARAKSHYCRPF